MTHFGENTEFIEGDPVNLMLPSDSTKTVSILNYRPPKFHTYEFFKPNPRKKTSIISTPNQTKLTPQNINMTPTPVKSTLPID